MRRSGAYLAIITLLLAVAAGLTGWGRWFCAVHWSRQLPAQRQLVGTLQLTDLALWSEARYTRHPAMADQFSAFQDHPGAMEHFPAGTLLAPAGPRPQTTLEVRRRGGGAG